MTLSQRLSIKASEQRSRLAELAELAELTDEQRAELGTLGATHQDTESQLRASIAADDAATPPGDPVIDSEVRERLELRSKTGIGDFLAAAVGGSAVTGAAAEYAAALGVPLVGHLPMAIFERTAPAVETRAITPGPAVKGTLQPTVPYVFERSAAASLGIMMPTVPIRSGPNPEDHHGATGRHAGEGRRGSVHGGGGHAGQSGSGPNRRKFRGPSRGFGRDADAGIGAQRVDARLDVERAWTSQRFQRRKRAI